MKNRIALLAAALWEVTAGAQAIEPRPLDDPPAATRGGGAADFAPAGWRVETQTSGDLNSDGIADLAFVLLAEDAADYLVVRPGEEDSPGAPRMLAIAFGRPDGRYELALQERTFLSRKTPPNGLSKGLMLFEPGSIEVGKGRLRIIFEYTRGSATFTFRWQRGALRLIGYDSGGVEGGCSHHLSVNFLSHRARMTAGWIDQDEEQVRWRSLKRRPLMTVGQIGDGGEFNPHGLWTDFPLTCPERN